MKGVPAICLSLYPLMAMRTLAKVLVEQVTEFFLDKRQSCLTHDLRTILEKALGYVGYGFHGKITFDLIQPVADER
jgi:hypothetical protein